MSSYEPDLPFNPGGFAENWWEFNRKLMTFEDHLLCLGDEGFDFDRVWTDSYDLSLEIGKVPIGIKLNEAQKELIRNCGFLCVFINYDNAPYEYIKLC